MVPEIMAKAKEKGVAPWHQIPSSIAFFFIHFGATNLTRLFHGGEMHCLTFKI
jgi:hypothetical protein